MITPAVFREFSRDRVPLAGGTRQGVFFGDGTTDVDINALQIVLPVTDAPRLCVNLQSRDGTYEAQAEYRLHGVPSGRRYTMSLPTKYRNSLNAMRALDLGVLAYLSSSCPGPMQAILPVAWSAQAATDSVTILVNSQRASARIFSLQLDRYFTCNSLADQESRTFDMACRVSIAPGAPTVELKLVRKRDERRLQEVRIPLSAP